MSQLNDVHPGLDRLTAFGQGRLDPEDEEEVARHVAGCDSCTEALRQVPDDTLIEQLRAANAPASGAADTEAPGPAPTAGPPAEPPAELRDHPRYRIVKCLGAGGMGVVYLAEHRLMERTVALKVIGRQWTQDAQAVERFRQEVRAAARLQHPNIVHAYDAEQAGDVHFLVMEYVKGASLAEVVGTKGPPPVAQACQYARQAALGLQHAFERGMVHRDVKPHNLMLTRKGQVKILDFGLARLAAGPAPDKGPSAALEALRAGPASAAAGAPGGTSRLTALGMLLGTPDYMAPEQALDSAAADVRADIYSLGCTLYFLLTGRPPFPGGDAYSKLMAHQEETPPPPGAGRADVPPELDAVVARMMAKAPAQRYRTPAEVAAALAPFTRGARTTPHPTVPSSDAPPDDTPPPVPPPHPPPGATPTWAGGKTRRRPRRLLVPAAAAVFVALTSAVLYGLIAAFCGWPPFARNGTAANSGPAVPAGRGRILLVVSHTGFWYPDYQKVRGVLDGAGASVKVASSQAGEAQPSRETREENPDPKPITADLALADARAADYDAVVFLGGTNYQEFTGQGPGAAAARKLIADMLAADGKYVTAICTGTMVLADAGVLKGKKATTHPAVKDQLKSHGVAVLDQPVVTEGRIITGRMPPDAEDFARAVLRAVGQAPATDAASKSATDADAGAPAKGSLVGRWEGDGMVDGNPAHWTVRVAADGTLTSTEVKGDGTITRKFRYTYADGTLSLVRDSGERESGPLVWLDANRIQYDSPYYGRIIYTRTGDDGAAPADGNLVGVWEMDGTLKNGQHVHQTVRFTADGDMESTMKNDAGEEVTTKFRYTYANGTISLSRSGQGVQSGTIAWLDADRIEFQTQFGRLVYTRTGK